MPPRKFSLQQEDNATPSNIGSFHDSLKTTSNISGKFNSFHSSGTTDMNHLANNDMLGHHYTARTRTPPRNWTKPPNASPSSSQGKGKAISPTSAAGTASAGSRSVSVAGGHNASASGPGSLGGVLSPTNHAGNNAQTSVAGGGGSTVNRPSQNKTPASATVAARKKGKVTANAEKKAIRRALGADAEDADDEGGNDRGGNASHRTASIFGSEFGSGGLGSEAGNIPQQNNNNNNISISQQPTISKATAPKKAKATGFAENRNTTSSSSEDDAASGGGYSSNDYGDDGNNHHYSHSSNNTVSGTATSNSNSDSDDPNADYLSLGNSSTSSASSNSRRTKEMKARPIIVYMLALIAVPVIFLAIYQALAVDSSLKMLQFMKNHEAPIIFMIHLQQSMQDEVLAVSELIGTRLAYGISGESAVPSWAPRYVKTNTTAVNALFVSTRESLRNLLVEVADDTSGIPAFHSTAIRLPEWLSKAEIAANRNQGKLYRQHMEYVMTQLTSMIAALQTDERAKLFSTDLIDMQLLGRVEEQFILAFALYSELETSVNGSNTYFQNLAAQNGAGLGVGAGSGSSMSGSSNSSSSSSTSESTLQECLDFSRSINRMEALVEYLEVGSGNGEVSKTVSAFITTGFAIHREAYDPFFKCSFLNSTSWGNIPQLEATFDLERNKISDAMISLFEKVVNNKEVQQAALVEGMKLMIAILACVIGVAVVIYIQKRERTELFQIIDHSEQLAMAVRRFVPKSQLRMMGVRSVLQIESGFSVEVANTLVSSSIGSFELIAEKMSRLELFDWLQMYVARTTYVVQQCRGYIDSIRGDKILAVFAQATHGLNAAIMMQQESDHMNVDLIATRQTDLINVRTAVHTGICVAGVFGDANRLTCTMVARDINLTQRLVDELTQRYKSRIIISHQVHDQINADNYEMRSLGTIEGFPSEVYDVYQADEAQLKAFKHLTKENFERAILLSTEDSYRFDPSKRLQAKALFEGIRDRGKELNITDGTVLVKLRELEMIDGKSTPTNDLIEVQRTSQGGSPIRNHNENVLDISETQISNQNNINNPPSLPTQHNIPSIAMSRGIVGNNNNNNNNIVTSTMASTIPGSAPSTSKLPNTNTNFHSANASTFSANTNKFGGTPNTNNHNPSSNASPLGGYRGHLHIQQQQQHRENSNNNYTAGGSSYAGGNKRKGYGTDAGSEDGTSRYESGDVGMLYPDSTILPSDKSSANDDNSGRAGYYNPVNALPHYQKPGHSPSTLKK